MIPLASIKAVEESSSSSLINLKDSLTLVGVDVFEVNLRVECEGDPMKSVKPQKGVSYRMQFSVLKDMLVSSGEEREHGGRRC